jgi:hypothetical protein
MSARSRATVVVWGLLAHAPFGGMIWQVLHHLVGLRQLGYDVWYVEDSDQRMLNVQITDWVMSAGDNAAYVRPYLKAIGLADSWIIRSPGTRECFGAGDWDRLLRLYREADLVMNLCGSHKLQPHHDAIRSLMYVETDPVATQVALASNDEANIAELGRYDTLTTYATNLGGDDCLIPESGRTWLITVPPVVTCHWRTAQAPASRQLTTVMNWSSPEGFVEWQGRQWSWSKQEPMRRLAALPTKSPVPLVLALRGGSPDVKKELSSAGWKIVGDPLLDRPGVYRRFIRASAGELSAAKEQYVGPRSGWISDRTVCYLAAGRPAIVERTGIAGIPTGEGLLVFTGVDEAAAAIEAVVSDYPRHAAAARELAETCFAADRVMASLLARAGF